MSDKKFSTDKAAKAVQGDINLWTDVSTLVTEAGYLIQQDIAEYLKTQQLKCDYAIPQTSNGSLWLACEESQKNKIFHMMCGALRNQYTTMDEAPDRMLIERQAITLTNKFWDMCVESLTHSYSNDGDFAVCEVPISCNNPDGSNLSKNVAYKLIGIEKITPQLRQLQDMQAEEFPHHKM